MNEPFASGLIYSAVFSVWMYLALMCSSQGAAAIGAGLAFVAGILGTRAFYWWVTWSEDFRGTGRRINRWWVWCQLSDKRDRRRLKKAVDRFCEVLQRSPVAPGSALIVEQVLVLDENARASAYRRQSNEIRRAMLQLHSARGKLSDAALEAWETLQANLDGRLASSLDQR